MSDHAQDHADRHGVGGPDELAASSILTAGDGLAYTGSTLYVVVDGSTIEINTDTLRIGAGAAGSGLSGGGGSALAVNVDNSTIEIVTDTLQVKDSGITSAKIADSTITLADLANEVLNLLVPVGTSLDYEGIVLPSQFLWEDGSSVSRTTYADLWDVVHATLGTFTVTIASPGVVTLNAHGLQDGEPVYLTTTGALPTGLTANTTYYTRNVAANTFRLSATRGGTAINTSGTQSGTHTAVHVPHTIPAGSTTNFYLPDRRGVATIGKDNMGGTAASRVTQAVSGLYALALGALGGDQNMHQHTHTQNSHLHSMNMYAGYQAAIAVYRGPDAVNLGGNPSGTQNVNSTTATNQNTGSGAAQNVQPSAVVNKIIRY